MRGGTWEQAREIAMTKPISGHTDYDGKSFIKTYDKETQIRKIKVVLYQDKRVNLEQLKEMGWTQDE